MSKVNDLWNIFNVLYVTTGLFETRLDEYRDEMEKLGPTVKQNIKVAGKKFINFFKESGMQDSHLFVQITQLLNHV